MAFTAPISCDKLREVLPALPFLVVIIITPAFARVPYKAAALGPFKISIFSISAGLISANLLGA